MTLDHDARHRRTGTPIDALRQADPLLHGIVAIDPMPEATLADLWGDVLAELGVGPRFARGQLFRHGRPASALEAWHVETVVVLDAEHVPEAALEGLREAAAPNGVRVLVLGRGTAGADPSVEGLVRQVDTERPEDVLLGDSRVRERLGALAFQLRVECGHLRTTMHRVGLVSAAAPVFDRPRSLVATRLRLLAFEDAASELGYELRSTSRRAWIDAASRGAWPSEWIDEALSPHPSRLPPLHRDSRRATARRFNDDSIGAWVAQRPLRTRERYAQVLRMLAGWRLESGIGDRAHDEGSLDEWGDHLLRQGMGAATVVQAMVIARGFYAHLLAANGRPTEPASSVTAPGAPSRTPARGAKRRFANPYMEQARPAIEAILHGAEAVRPPIHSREAKRLMAQRGWDVAEFWAAVDAVQLTEEQFAAVDDVLPGGPKRRRIHGQRFKGVLFILVFDIAAGALPREVGAGAAWTVVRWVRAARGSGLWVVLVDRLRQFRELSELDWERPI